MSQVLQQIFPYQWRVPPAHTDWCRVGHLYQVRLSTVEGDLSHRPRAGKGPNIGAHVGDINVTLLAHELLLQIVELDVSSQGYSLQVLIVSVGERFADYQDGRVVGNAGRGKRFAFSVHHLSYRAVLASSTLDVSSSWSSKR